MIHATRWIKIGCYRYDLFLESESDIDTYNASHFGSSFIMKQWPPFSSEASHAIWFTIGVRNNQLYWYCIAIHCESVNT